MPRLHYSLWLGLLLIGAALFIISRIIGARGLSAAYNAKLAETPRERLFWASLGFFVALAVVRTLTFLIHNQIRAVSRYRDARPPYPSPGVGYLAPAPDRLWMAVTGGDWHKRTRTWAGRTMAMAYGVGAALTLDEFALWLNLRDVYWERQGRESFEALAFFAAALATAAGRSVCACSSAEVHALPQR